MEQLVRNRFWIATGAAILLAIGGWYMGKKIRAETDTRRKTIDGAFGKLKSVNDKTPTKEWAAGLDTINVAEKKKHKEAVDKLVKTQASNRVFPQRIEDDAKAEKVDLKYIGVAKGVLPKRASDWYRLKFIEYARGRFFSKITPYIESENDEEGGEKKNEGKIYFANAPSLYVELEAEQIIQPPQPSDSVVRQSRYPGKWRTRAPSHAEIWEVMEDQWLIESILDALESVNKNYDNIRQTPIKVVEKLELRGGSRASLNQKRSAAAATAQPAAKKPATPAPVGVGVGLPYADPTGQGDKKKNDVNIEIPLDEVFGEAGAAAKPGAGAKPGQPALAGAKPTATAAATTGGSRYIDGPADSGAYLTRGFSITVIMEPDDVPELLERLRKSPWPAKIVHVHRGKFDELKVGTKRKAGGTDNIFGGGPAVLAPTGMGEDDDDKGKKKKESTLSTALEDPKLVRVAIAGLFYIAKPDGMSTASSPAGGPPGGPPQPGGLPQPGGGLPQPPGGHGGGGIPTGNPTGDIPNPAGGHGN